MNAPQLAQVAPKECFRPTKRAPRAELGGFARGMNYTPPLPSLRKRVFNSGEG